MQTVKEKLSDMKEMRKVKAEARAEEQVSDSEINISFSTQHCVDAAILICWSHLANFVVPKKLRVFKSNGQKR